MPSALDRTIESLSDPEVSLPDALRRLFVVSRRMKAQDLSAWLQFELNGYQGDAQLPLYRKASHFPIELSFDGLYGSSSKFTISPAELPDHLARASALGSLIQPVAELVALCEGSVDPALNLPTMWVQMYRNEIESGKVPSESMMVLNHAAIKMPRTNLRGIIDRIKSSALDLALQVEDISADAGEAGGPTVRDNRDLRDVVGQYVTQIFGDVHVADGGSLALGSGAMAIQEGDIEGLRQAARSILTEDAVNELVQAIERDGGQPRQETNSFLDRVKRAGYGLVGGMASSGAYDGLVAMLQQAFPAWLP